MLGLCPLLAVSTTLLNGIILGLASTFVLLLSSCLISSVRFWIYESVRIPIFVFVIGCNVTLIDLFLQATFYPLHQVLGMFVPLIVTNCLILSRMEIFASRYPVGWSALDALTCGIGFIIILSSLGALREYLSYGVIFSDVYLLNLSGLPSELPQVEQGFLLALLPPGAFFGLSLLFIMGRLSQLLWKKRTRVVQLVSG